MLGNRSLLGEGDEIFELNAADRGDGVITVFGANIIGANEAAFDTSNTDGDGSVVNATAAVNASATDVFAATVDNNGVLAGVLADNGGPVQTIALKADKTNPALDAAGGSDPDGRGLPRVDLDGVDNGGFADLGAFEVQDQVLFAPTITSAAAITVAEGQTTVTVITANDD